MPYFPRRLVTPVLAVLLALGLLPQASAAAQETTPAHGVPSCRDQIRVVAELKTWELRGDCVTDVPITVPQSGTFDGQGHTIRVVDPPGGRFVGGVLERRGGISTVRNVTIDGSGLDQSCGLLSWAMGVWFDRAGGEIVGVTVINLRRGVGLLCGWGIVVGPGAHPAVALRDNTVISPGGTGIFIGEGEATVTGNSVTGADAIAVYSSGAGARLITGNQILESVEGIVLSGDSVGSTITENVVGRTEEAAIFVLGPTRATVSGNEVTDAANMGIAAGEGAIVEVKDNTIRGAGYGIDLFDEGTAGHITGNTITDAQNAGIGVTEGARAEVTRNVISGGPEGIRFQDRGTTGTIVGNDIMAAASIGIAVVAGAEATVAGNSLAGGSLGIVFHGGGTTGTIDSNTIQDANDIGIAVAAGASATVTGNTVMGPQSVDRPEDLPVGINFLAQAVGRITDNTVTGYFNIHSGGRACGIRIAAAAGAVEMSGNQFSSPGNETDVCDER